MTRPKPPTDAERKFAKGERVMATMKGHEYGAIRSRAGGVYGTVCGFGRRPNGHVVRVIIEGNKTPTSYHMDFWRPCNPRGG